MKKNNKRFLEDRLMMKKCELRCAHKIPKDPEEKIKRLEKEIKELESSLQKEGA